MDVEELSVGGYQLSDGGERIEGGERVKLKAKSSTRKLFTLNSRFSTIRWVYSQPVFVFDFANKAPLLMG